MVFTPVLRVVCLWSSMPHSRACYLAVVGWRAGLSILLQAHDATEGGINYRDENENELDDHGDNNNEFHGLYSFAGWDVVHCKRLPLRVPCPSSLLAGAGFAYNVLIACDGLSPSAGYHPSAYRPCNQHTTSGGLSVLSCLCSLSRSSAAGSTRHLRGVCLFVVYAVIIADCRDIHSDICHMFRMTFVM
jgi:hypothetical protein